MGRGKTELKRIENTTRRQVTFSKRRKGLIKKAHELSVLCDVDVSLLIFSPSGKLTEFSNSNMQKSIQRYQRYRKGMLNYNNKMQGNLEQLKDGISGCEKSITTLELSKRKLLGEELNSCSIEELESLEKQLDQSLRNIRQTKDELFQEEINTLKAKCNVQVHASTGQKESEPYCQSNESCEVVTELFIGRPETRRKPSFTMQAAN